MFVCVGAKNVIDTLCWTNLTAFKHALFVHPKHLVLATCVFEAHLLQNNKIAIYDEIEPGIFPRRLKHFQNLNPNIELFSVNLDRKIWQLNWFHSKLILRLLSKKKNEWQNSIYFTHYFTYVRSIYAVFSTSWFECVTLLIFSTYRSIFPSYRHLVWTPFVKA